MFVWTYCFQPWRCRWGGMITFLALAHMLDATQLGWGWEAMLTNVPCTFTHVGCYATGLGWAGDGNVPCTCTQVGCYATGVTVQKLPGVNVRIHPRPQYGRNLGYLVGYAEKLTTEILLKLDIPFISVNYLSGLRSITASENMTRAGHSGRVVSW